MWALKFILIALLCNTCSLPQPVPRDVIAEVVSEALGEAKHITSSPPTARHIFSDDDHGAIDGRGKLDILKSKENYGRAVGDQGSHSQSKTAKGRGILTALKTFVTSRRVAEEAQKVKNSQDYKPNDNNEVLEDTFDVVNIDREVDDYDDDYDYYYEDDEKDELNDDNDDDDYDDDDGVNQDFDDYDDYDDGDAETAVALFVNSNADIPNSLGIIAKLKLLSPNSSIVLFHNLSKVDSLAIKEAKIKTVKVVKYELIVFDMNQYKLSLYLSLNTVPAPSLKL